MEKKFYWLHSFLVSSGKDKKLIQKIYSDEKVANENLVLMGGALNKLVEV
ncbi:hypothetical protein GAP52_049 [Cronobacter phage vB_CsaP_GAP52]|uniref:Uncharacterized protein n=1 Tax=Cronobacter phage vB_CsaP_GAP52 TaxID=1141137 RepID=K4F7W5_9CAUD|nr:hypothetical protein D858_gp066 [Cronobacter phage vB_CsaP_GAP52]AFC22042.1 hypothetical protein GAP52_049 [Cronobacter phage vB_CsaP_GAP52]